MSREQRWTLRCHLCSWFVQTTGALPSFAKLCPVSASCARSDEGSLVAGPRAKADACRGMLVSRFRRRMAPLFEAVREFAARFRSWPAFRAGSLLASINVAFAHG